MHNICSSGSVASETPTFAALEYCTALRSLSIRYDPELRGPPYPTASERAHIYKTFVRSLAAFIEAAHVPDTRASRPPRFPGLTSFRLALRASASVILSERPDPDPFEALACALASSTYQHLACVSVVMEAVHARPMTSLEGTVRQASAQDLERERWDAYVLMVEEAFSMMREKTSITFDVGLDIFTS